MTLADAVRLLRTGGRWADLGEAIGVVIASPESSVFDILPGLKHGGFIAEQAALALYKRTGRPLPEDRTTLVTDLPSWADWISSIESKPVRQEPSMSSVTRPPDFKRDLLRTFDLDRLPREERLVVLLYYFEEMTFDEIRSVLDVSDSTIHRLLRSALGGMRARLSPDSARFIRDLVA